METAPPDLDRGPHLAAVYIAGCAISFVVVVMRMMARYSIASVGLDDWVMLVTWVSLLLRTTNTSTHYVEDSLRRTHRFVLPVLL